jgi:hypothetical protein
MTEEEVITELGFSVDNYFGGCPECGNTGGFLNVGRDHWYVCHEHKFRWSPGSNLLDSWRHEDESIWAKNREILREYIAVESAPQQTGAHTPSKNTTTAQCRSFLMMSGKDGGCGDSFLSKTLTNHRVVTTVTDAMLSNQREYQRPRLFWTLRLKKYEDELEAHYDGKGKRSEQDILASIKKCREYAVELEGYGRPVLPEPRRQSLIGTAESPAPPFP